MHSNQSKKVLGIFCIVIGSVIFLSAAGEFLIRLLVAGGALLLINYGQQCLTGRSTLVFFSRWTR
ncbi:MAG: hypothetical protein P4L31_05465 [Candidatus Babeliales bacterium]|nr:hypothetical protein [Candidatus Babeliales bacterium]